MTETEKLKEQADVSLHRQKLKEISKYLESIDKKTERQIKTFDRIQLVSNCLMVGFLVSFVWNIVAPHIVALILREVLMILWWLSLIVGLVGIGMIRASMREFIGACKILYILGIVDKDPDEIGKKKRTKDLATEFAKMWEKQKKDAQEKVYQPV